MTFTVDLGLIGVFLGLVGVIATIVLGIRPGLDKVTTALDKVTTALEVAQRDVAAVRQKSEAIWDILLQRSSGTGAGATVTLRLKNLGEVKISARPGSEETEYVVATEKSFVRSNLIIRLAKTTSLEAKEREIFADKIPTVSDLTPGRVLFRLPSTDANLCTKYMREVVYWLDSVYFDTVGEEIDRYEKPILNGEEPLNHS
jgi:hypothetical protein